MLPIWEWLASIFPDRLLFSLLIGANSLLAIYLLFREVMRSRTSQGSIAWLLSLLMLPFPTTLLYLIFGLKLFDKYVAIQTHSGRSGRISRAGTMAFADQSATAKWRVLSEVAQMPFLGGNKVEVLIDGDATFKSIFEGITRAQHTILAQFYIIRDDGLGRRFADALIERARAGVAIYLLYDDVGSFGLPRQYRQRLRDAGIRVAGFNQRHGLLRIYGPTRVNYRNHRKNVIVDGREAWVGGQNIGDEYLGLSKRFGRWRDTQVHYSGPAAAAATLAFHEDWEWATGTALPHSITPTLPVEAAGAQPILVMPTGPADQFEDVPVAFMEAISRAKVRLWIVSPYFVPDVDMQTAIYAAVLRGVDVRLMIPAKADHLLVWLASRAHAAEMVQHGVAVYLWTDGFVHQKVILVDDELAGVGTVNFDNRSFRINFEVTLWFPDQEVIGTVSRMLESDFAASQRYTEAERHLTGLPFRLLTHIARLFSPIL